MPDIHVRTIARPMPNVLIDLGTGFRHRIAGRRTAG